MKDYMHKQDDIENLGLRKNFFFYHCITKLQVTPLLVCHKVERLTVFCTKIEGSQTCFMVSIYAIITQHTFTFSLVFKNAEEQQATLT